MNQLGPELFQATYSYLRYQRFRPDPIDEKTIQQELLRMIGGDKKLKSALFNLDLLVYQEIAA